MAEEKKMRGVNAQHDWKRRQPFLGWRVLSTRVDLLPQREVVVDAGVVRHVERHARHVVENDIRKLCAYGRAKVSCLRISDGNRLDQTHEEVPEVDDGPCQVLRHARDRLE